MFEHVPQELKESVEKALRKASRDAYSLLDEAAKLVEEVSQQLDAWADELATAGGSDDEPTPQDKYDYIMKHASAYEKVLWAGAVVKDYLLEDTDVLDRLYKEKLGQVTKKAENFYFKWSDINKWL